MPRVNYCIDCGKEISQWGMRCSSCAAKARWAGKGPSVKICPDCGVNILPSSERCFKCAMTRRKKPPRLCPDCSKEIGKDSPYCRPCSARHTWENEEIRNKRLSAIQDAFPPRQSNYCVDCGVEITPGESKRCRKCASNTPERIAQMSKARKGKRLSRSWRQSISEGVRKKVSDPQHLEKLSKAQVERWSRPGQREQHSRVMKDVWKTNPMGGEERNRKASETKRVNFVPGKFSGPNSPSWQGGKSFEPYGYEFNSMLKAQIRERDDRQSVLCSAKEGRPRHHVHHIDYNKKNNNPNNLVTLCPTCHRRTNWNREYWLAGFKQIQVNYV